jgi:hypothetical protein
MANWLVSFKTHTKLNRFQNGNGSNQWIKQAITAMKLPTKY